MYIILYVDTSKACEPSKMPICRQWISINNRSQKHVSDEIHFLNDVWLTANNIGDILLQFKAIVVCFNVLWNVIYFCDAKQRVSISIIAPVFSVSWSFRKYSNMLICHQHWKELGCLFFLFFFSGNCYTFFQAFWWKKVKKKIEHMLIKIFVGGYTLRKPFIRGLSWQGFLTDQRYKRLIVTNNCNIA